MNNTRTPIPVHLTADPEKSRLTVVETVYYHQKDSTPICYDHRFGRSIDSEDQSYLRTTVVDEKWKQLDTGWIKQASMVIIKNEAGIYKVNPTIRQREEEEAKVIELSILPSGIDPIALIAIPVQSSVRLSPVYLASMMIRCQKGEARYSVVIIPA